MALSKLSGDEQGILFVQLCNVLDPGIAVALASVSNELRTATRVPLQAAEDWPRGGRSVVPQPGTSELQGAARGEGGRLANKGLTADGAGAAGHAGLGAAGARDAGPHRAQAASQPRRRAAAGGGAGRGRAAGRDRACLSTVRMWATQAPRRSPPPSDKAPCRGSRVLDLDSAAIGDAGLVALAPALRRLPALERLVLNRNPFGDEGLAALVAPPPPAGAPPPTTGGLAQLKLLEPQLHPDHRRWLRHPRRCARQRRAAGARARSI